ncbi:MAG: sugar phosphate isomerase/epimerase family protein, partial [Hydrogenophaga sp.]
PALRTMLDCCAAARAEAEPVPAVLARWLPTGLLAHVQVNDPNLRGPGQGALAFADILRTLCQHGYAGWVAVEPFDYQPDGPMAAARAIGYLRGLLEALH